MLRQRDYVLPADVEAVVRDAFRHRLVLSYQALAEEVTADQVLDQVLAAIAPPQIDLGRPRHRGGVKGLIAAAGRERTPARPGPGRDHGREPRGARAGDRPPRRRAARRRLPLGVRRRRHRALPGAARTRPATTSAGSTGTSPPAPAQTHVRVELAERVLVTWLVFDASASMAFGTAERRKADVAEGVALAIGHTATRRGNRLGLVAFGADDPRWRRPRQGRRGLLLTLAALRDEPAGERRALRGADAARRARASSARSSSSSPTSAARSTGATRCSASPAAIRRSRSRSATRASRSSPTSASCGSSIPRPAASCASTRATASLRERFADAAAEERTGLVRMLSAAGVRHVALSTEGDWLRQLAAFLKRSDF